MENFPARWTAAGYGQWTFDYTKADPWLIACAGSVAKFENQIQGL